MFSGTLTGTISASVASGSGTFEGNASVVLAADGTSSFSAAGTFVLGTLELSGRVQYSDLYNWSASVSGSFGLLGVAVTVNGTISSAGGNFTGSLSATLSAELGPFNFSGAATLAVSLGYSASGRVIEFQVDASGTLEIAGQTIHASVTYTDADNWTANLDRALAFASNLGDAYAMASPQVRRNLNQSMFEEIAIEVDGSIVHAPMQQPFAAFHDEGFRGWIMDGAKTNPGPLPDRGSNEDILVEVVGFEPTTPCLQSRCATNCAIPPTRFILLSAPSGLPLTPL